MNCAKRTFWNILSGVGSVLDLMPAPPRARRRARPKPSPWESLSRDGAKVGKDLYTALRRLQKSAGAHHG
jgi:hypothetical protein